MFTMSPMEDAMINPSTLWPSIVRTIVPIIVGWLLALPLTGTVLAVFGLNPDTASAWLTQLATVLLSSLYYVIVRLFEKYVSPYFGLLLGWLKQPAAYVPPAAAR